jgi:hypothetical protein
MTVRAPKHHCGGQASEKAMKNLAATGIWMIAVSAGIVSATFLTTTAESHHSFAMYDDKTTRTLTGRLTRFIPGANHAQLIFQVLDADGGVALDENGEPVLWGVETGPAAMLARQGVTVKSFPVGTVFTVVLNPLRDGRNFGALSRKGGRLIKCGTELPAGGCTEQTGQVFLTD